MEHRDVLNEIDNHLSKIEKLKCYYNDLEDIRSDITSLLFSFYNVVSKRIKDFDSIIQEIGISCRFSHNYSENKPSLNEMVSMCIIIESLFNNNDDELDQLVVFVVGLYINYCFHCSFYEGNFLEEKKSVILLE